MEKADSKELKPDYECGERGGNWRSQALDTHLGDMVKQLIRAYRRGMNYHAFWELVARVHAFSEMRKYLCEKV